ncbi:unnamed protein product [Sphenostylis stenocarpa]|uniref:Uncharacterized protein n=1 Tax=Sphenostylis stenocarpa TaxID=92480 RepID=A0AA86VZT0_9FABA|nr:unnamed protein product [Sphenostylis stenocarpa]
MISQVGSTPFIMDLRRQGSRVKGMSGIICKVVLKRFWDGPQVDFSDKVRFVPGDHS